MDSSEIVVLIDELEERVERLRALYEQYFMGIERLEPLILRKDVDRRLWVLRRTQVRNTGVRFRLQGVVQRYNTYQQYWQRIVREIENGTYQRDLARAAARFGDAATTTVGRRRQKMFERGLAKRNERLGRSSRPAPATTVDPPGGGSSSLGGLEAGSTDDLEIEIDVDMGPDSIAKPMRLPSDRPTDRGIAPVVALPAAAKPPAAAPTRSASDGSDTSAADRSRMVRDESRTGERRPGRDSSGRSSDDARSALISDTRLQQLYGQYVEAKRQCNEPTESLTFDKLASKLRQNAASLKEKHKARRVDFEVIIKNGAALLKPIVKKSRT